MKNYAKVGGRKGKPAYRTPSSFKARQHQRLRARRAHLDASRPNK